jgi:hypothetical protein
LTTERPAPAEAGATADRAAAEARVRAFLDHLGRLGSEDLLRTALAASADTPARQEARREAARLARSHGLEPTLEAAIEAVREHVRHLYDRANYRPTMVGLNWGLSEGTVADRVEFLRAAEDAVAAAVIEPHASDALMAELSSGFELVARGQSVTGSMDLTEATARALQPALHADRSYRLVIGVGVVVVIAAALLTGLWIIAVAVVFLAAVLELVRRRALGRADG